ncbi:hypothetical protein [Actinoplanes sp. NBRC 101535]|uniref:hypothetical protein n=1 Tax=Actinoplanes sp. NBRC 101535 TaxID=3032196 RepID=UPI0024A4A019|nr:hypothetical protein [Actinoplanes sp. NBRC 101535]GLY02251.1 hypothetical protein Acsp01_26300 [Actinoplanes sp. NBRC 101535]
MSFDLAVWYQPDPLESDAAYSVYDRLTDGDEGVVVRSPAISAFLEALLLLYPENGNGASPPWASGVYSNAECVLLSISWSRSDEVARVVERVAGENGLSVFDPQSRVMKNPA